MQALISNGYIVPFLVSNGGQEVDEDAFQDIRESYMSGEVYKTDGTSEKLTTKLRAKLTKSIKKEPQIIEVEAMGENLLLKEKASRKERRDKFLSDLAKK